MTSLKQKPIGLLDLPPEIRIQIYSNVLNVATVNTGLGTIPRVRVPAREKLRLLLVNKSIFAEALPIFHKHHTVLVRINDYPQLRLFFLQPLHRRFDLLVNLDIVFNEGIYDLDSANSDIEISRHLRLVNQTCKYLKTLLLELRPTSLAGAWTFIHSHWRRSWDQQARPQANLPPSWALNPQAPAPPAFTQPGFVLSTASLPPMTTEEMELHYRWHGPHVIDKNGKTVLALKSIWQRLDRLTIVLPTEGDYGVPAFMGYVGEQLLQGIEPEKTWWFSFDNKDRWTKELTDRWTYLFFVDKSRQWIRRGMTEK